jgi:multidrug/hemolysin transport system permease protein
MSVFFSLLSIIILLGIYILFLGSIYSDLEILSGVENTVFIWGYIMGGVIVIGTITLSLGVVGAYVSDLESKKINGFLVSPIKRSNLTISYYLSTVILTLFLTLVMFLIMFFYLGIFMGYWYPPILILKVILTIIVFVFISTSFVVFLATLIKSNNAFGGISAVIGTVIGFVGGIYIPLSMLSSFMVSLAGLFPFSYMTIFLRKMLIGSEILLKVPNEAVVGMGIIDLDPFNLNLSIYVIFGIFIAVSLGLLVLTYFRANKKAK